MGKFFNRAVVSLAARFGYAVVPNWRTADLPLENHLKALFRRYEVDTVFDVGANAGQYHGFLRERVDFDGIIHSFEPVSSSGDAIAGRIASDPGWRLHRHALGSENAVMEINVAARDTFSSFREPIEDAGSRFSASTAVRRREKVRVVRLDDIWRNLHPEHPEKIYLKIDTLGFDLEVMRGARDLLRSIRALQFELAVQAIYKGGAHYLEVLRQLNEWGFELSALFPVATDEDMRAVELDCVMVAGGR